MSFDVYIQVFDAGRQGGFSLQRLRAIFGAQLAELEDDYWQVRYADGESSDLFLQPAAQHPSLIHTLCVHRPCSSPLLWHALYSLLDTPGALFHFPGGSIPLTRDVDIANAMPGDLLATWGTPLRIDSAEQLRQSVDALQVP